MPASIAASRVRFSQSLINFFWIRSACVPPLARLASHCATAASNPDAGTTCSIKPHCSACAAPKFSPSSSIARARPQPVRCGSSAASTTDGMPRWTSGMPKSAPSTATRRSQAAANSSPAPSATPLMRAITGAGKRRTASQQRWTWVMKCLAPSASRPDISPMSAPPTKARSPAPVSTSACKSASRANSARQATKACISALFRLLARRGLSIVTRQMRTPGARVSKRV